MKTIVIGGYPPELVEGISKKYQYFPDPKSGLEALQREHFDVVVTGLHIGTTTGFDILRTVREHHLDLIVIVTSSDKDPKSNLDCYALGAAGFVFEPFEIEELDMMIQRYHLEKKSRKELERYRKESLPKEIDAELVGSSVALMRVKNSILQYAPSPATVLLRGESGTGKGVVARLIHTHSSRHEGPFLSLNCGAIPENLMESELFGYERGAFTGAVNAKTGIFEQADGGTLFLDEIGELPQAMQVKLLKVLEDKVVRRLGGSREIPVNVRIVAATNKDLEKAFATREFREDLFYRLNVLSLNLPPLRERRDDVPALAKSLLVQMGREMNRPNLDFSPEAYEKMSSYDWPGNVRELKNIVERALIRGEAALIGADSLDLKTTVGHSVVKENLGVPVAAGSSVNFMEEVSKKGLSAFLESLEKGILEETMRRCGENQTKAAQALSIKRTTLVQKLKRYGLE